jgi:hypothetical protein
MKALGIAHVGLAEADVQRLRAMLLLVLAEGTLSGNWHVSDPAGADLLVTTKDVLRQLSRSLPASATRLVAVLSAASEPAPQGAFSLATPIAMEALLKLMVHAEDRRMHPYRSSALARRHPLTQLAELIRNRGEGAPKGRTLRIEGLARAPIYAVIAHRQFYCSESLLAVAHFDAHTEVAIEPLGVEEVPAECTQPKPLVMLQWAVGLSTAPLGLLPWINEGCTFCLRTFPEFQILHHEPSHRRLAAAFARPVHGITGAMELMQTDPVAVCGFVNATELCGYLQTSPPSATAARRRSSRSGVVGIFRRALGIGPTADG